MERAGRSQTEEKSRAVVPCGAERHSTNLSGQMCRLPRRLRQGRRARRQTLRPAAYEFLGCKTNWHSDRRRIVLQAQRRPPSHAILQETPERRTALAACALDSILRQALNRPETLAVALPISLF